MSINPSALLIFRAREEETPEEKKKKQKELPREEKPKFLGMFNPTKTREPAIIPTPAPAQSKQQVQEPKVEQVIIQQPEKIQTIAQPIQPGPAAAAAMPQQMAQSKSSEQSAKPGGFKIFQKNERQQENMDQRSIYEGQKLSYKDVEASGESINIFANSDYISRRGPSGDKGQLSREAAKGQNCVWHPWRSAYAICGYCHRPFCFEDTMEFNRQYYCLEDIDNVSSTAKEKMGASGNTIGILAGILLLFAFLTFFYYSNGQVIYVFQYLNRAGLPFFLYHINSSYSLALIESMLMLLGFASALLMFLQSRKGFYLGIFTCLSSVMVFSYQYLTTGTLYLGIVAALTFFGFIALLYSGATGAETKERQGELIEQTSALENSMIHWPNVGRF